MIKVQTRIGSFIVLLTLRILYFSPVALLWAVSFKIFFLFCSETVTLSVLFRIVKKSLVKTTCVFSVPWITNCMAVLSNNIKHWN